MDWMNHNSGAVQAIMAIIIGVLTTVLIGVTWWYASLTRRMAHTLEQQLAASFHPNLEMVFLHHYQGKGTDQGVYTETVFSELLIRNKGDLPLKIISVFTKLIYKDQKFANQIEELVAQHRVVPPGGDVSYQITIYVPEGASTAEYERRGMIHCSDLAGVSKHSFSICDKDKGMVSQFSGFQVL
jgi:hypothetical protein